MYDFGVMIVGTSKYCHLSLSNSGPCDLSYSLSTSNQNGDIVPGEMYPLYTVYFETNSLPHTVLYVGNRLSLRNIVKHWC